jgi:flagellar motor protein MotB
MAAAVLGVLGGCTSSLKQEIVHLEDRNRSIASQLDRARQDLTLATTDQERCASLLADARNDNEGLRDELASWADRTQPEPLRPPPPAVLFATAGDLFRVGQAGLKPEAGRRLDAIVSAAQGEYAGQTIFIVGHTDNAPIRKSGWKDNYELSAQRALSVARYLRDAGVDPARLIAAGSGEYRPRSTNDTEAGRSTNRRIEFYAIELPADSAP